MFSFQTVFYVGGAVGLAWFAIWLLLVADEPKTHWFISDFEKRHIMANRYGSFTFLWQLYVCYSFDMRQRTYIKKSKQYLTVSRNTCIQCGMSLIFRRQRRSRIQGKYLFKI